MVNSRNKSGHTGVSWCKSSNRWIAVLTKNKKTYCGGFFKDINDAIEARKRLEDIHREAPTPPPKELKCSKCGKIKSLSDFPPAKKRKYGRGSWCRKCCNLYQKNEPALMTSRGMLCKVKGCNKGVRAKGFCRSHYKKLLRYGTVYPPKRPPVRNKIEIDGKISYITIMDEKKFLGKAIIDAEDIEKIKDYYWKYSHHHKHIGTYIRKKMVLLGAKVLGFSQNKIILYLNGDCWNNRKKNLKVGNQQMAIINSKPRANTESGRRGVYRSRHRWQATLTKKGKTYHGGYFDDLESAIRARERLESIHWKGLKVVKHPEE